MSEEKNVEALVVALLDDLREFETRLHVFQTRLHALEERQVEQSVTIHSLQKGTRCKKQSKS
jgi:hypothetical protein